MFLCHFNYHRVFATALCFLICLLSIIGLDFYVAAGTPSLVAAPQRLELVLEAGFEDRDDDEEGTEEAFTTSDATTISGSSLNTNPDLQETMDKADKFLAEGNYRVASKLWQSVLKQNEDTLFSLDEQIYISMSEIVERKLASLPADALRAYRVSADSDVKALRAQSTDPNDMRLLSIIVEQYFLSSEGDDAAFHLACLYLDQHDFISAIRLLNKVVQRYPDPSISLDQVWLRLAVGYVGLEDLTEAQMAVEQAVALGVSSRHPLLQAIQSTIRETPVRPRESITRNVWTSRWGNGRRRGVMPRLPEDILQNDLRTDWMAFYQPQASSQRGAVAVETRFLSHPKEIEKSLNKQEKTMISTWRQNRWRPSGTLLFHQQQVIHKTMVDLVTWDTRPERPKLRWRPMWLNKFFTDTATQRMVQISEYSDDGVHKSQPKRARDVQLFGDRIAQGMSIHQGVVYNLEGIQYDANGSSPRNPNDANDSAFTWDAQLRRRRLNRLCVYDLQTGKFLWRLPKLKFESGSDAPKPSGIDTQWGSMASLEDAGFMSAPIGQGNFLFTVISHSGSLWLYALDAANQGDLIWKTYLCEEPHSGSDPWSPIHLSLEGNSLYASCGTGVLFAVNAHTGAIQFAIRYPRTAHKNTIDDFGFEMELQNLDGAQDDVVIPIGNQLVLLASDSNTLRAFDRQTGEFLWATANRHFGKKFDYFIGVQGDLIFLGGRQLILAVDVNQAGKLVWLQTWKKEQSLGRAMLTPTSLFVPMEHEIVQYSTTLGDSFGQEVGRAQVELGTGAPLGNLYSDGQTIWILGANRVYRLQPVSTDDTSQDSDASLAPLHSQTQRVAEAPPTFPIVENSLLTFFAGLIH